MADEYLVSNESLGDKLMVAAIDFGTTFSGYAFSFRHDYLKDPLDIKMNQWITTNLISNKTPTAILLKPDKTFHSFGYDAEKKFAELTFDEEHINWYYFRRFKMELYRQGGLNRHLQLTASNGQKIPAMTIITMAIRFMKDHLMDKIKTRLHNMTDSDVFWVLTVPAIWNDAAKQFMREAALDAGIEQNNLQLCLEPEAASIYCQHVPLEKSVDGVTRFRVGTSYMVLDLGGGTADITVHQIAENMSIRELQKAGGGAWGGTQVDSLFSLFLQRVFGRDVYDQFKTKNALDNMELEQEFELIKRRVSVDSKDKETIRIPASFMSEFNLLMGDASPSEAILQTTYKHQVKLIGDKLRVEASVIHELFANTAQSIVTYVKNLCQKKNLNSVKIIIMVGGLSESRVIQRAIRKAFPDKRIIVPSEPELAVLRGAILFGYNPSIISARVAKLTYGTAGFMRFQEGIHPEEKKIEMEGKMLCEDCFIKYVEVGQILPINSVIGEKRYRSLRSEQKFACVPIFTSTEPNPRFVTDDSCSMLGVLQFAFSEESQDGSKPVLMRMVFGNVELSVEAKEELSGKTVSITFDCLG